MTSDEKAQKISIGFNGGQSIAARVKPDALTKLRAALEAGDSWYELVAEDSTAVLDLKKVDFVLIDSDEHRIGF